MPIIQDGESQTSQGGISLPFPTLYLWTLNGNAALESANKALYCGGFAVGRDKVDEFLKTEDRPIPAGFALVNKANRDNTKLQVYVAQNIYVAPIAFRQSWEMKDGSRNPQYTIGGSPHIQFLAYLGEEVQDALRPWGVVALTGRGYQAGYLQGAFRAFASKTKSAREQYGKPDARSFYAPIGTFGNEPQTQMVGKDAQSPITPIQTFIPKVIDQKLMQSLFVGDDILTEMNQILGEADEWLNAWKSRTAPAEYPVEETIEV